MTSVLVQTTTSKSAVVTPGSTKSVKVGISTKSVAVGILRGIQGIQGIPGDSADAITAIAGAALSGQRLVTIISGVANYYDRATAYVVTGFTKTAPNMGASVEIQTNGPMAGFSGLTPGAAYYASDAIGNISATPPISGLLIPVGYAVDASTLFIRLGPSYIQ